jgi:hypothetical protein
LVTISTATTTAAMVAAAATMTTTEMLKGKHNFSSFQNTFLFLCTS